MTFLKCSIHGRKYGEVTAEDKEREQIVSTGELELLSSVSFYRHSGSNVVVLNNISVLVGEKTFS